MSAAQRKARDAVLEELADERLAERQAEHAARADAERRQAEAAEAARKLAAVREAASKQWAADRLDVVDAAKALAAAIRAARASGVATGLHPESSDREISSLVSQALKPLASPGGRLGLIRLSHVKPQIIGEKE
jgi:hypothetical protein